MRTRVQTNVYCVYFALLSFLLAPFISNAQTVEIQRIKANISFIGESDRYADALNRLGWLYLSRSLDSALYYTEYALRISERRDYEKGRAEAFCNSSSYYLEKGNFYEAYKLANQALDLFKKLNDPEGECRMLMIISTISLREGKVPQAISYFQKAYNRSDQLEKDSVVSILLLHKLAAEAPFPEQHAYSVIINRARAVASKYNDEFVLQQIDLAEATYMADRNLSPHQYLPSLENILQTSMENGTSVLAIRSAYTLGDWHSRNNNPKKADAYYQSGISIAEDGGFDNLSLSGISLALNNAKNKPELRKKADMYSNILLGINNEKTVYTPHNGINLLEAALREKDLAITAANNKVNQTWIALLTIAALFTLLFALFSFRSYQAKQAYTVDLQQLISELERKNKVLEKNNDFHKKLISIMAHDLRQPFASIIMLDKTSAKENMSKGHFLAVIEKMRTTSEKSIQIMDGLLQWMKLQLIGLENHSRPVNLYTNINSAIQFNADLAAQKKVHINNLVGCQTEIYAQEDMLMFVNRNLINNALKFSPAKSVITIRAIAQNNLVQVSISDMGRGITTEVRDNLFTWAQHGSQSGNQVKGTGIALYICGDMIHKMGGNIWAENNNNEPGATFSYTLTVATPEKEISAPLLMQEESNS